MQIYCPASILISYMFYNYGNRSYLLYLLTVFHYNLQIEELKSQHTEQVSSNEQLQQLEETVIALEDQLTEKNKASIRMSACFNYFYLFKHLHCNSRF